MTTPNVVSATNEPGNRRRARAPRLTADQRREEILVAAHEVFGARGFHKASLGEIAEKVGITHQGILHHFGSKEQLFVEALALRERLDVAGFENNQPPGGPAMLRHLLHTAVLNTGRVGLVQSYTVMSAESVTEGHPAQDFFRTRFAVLREQIAQALETSTSAVQPPAAELDAAASSIIAVMDGLQVQWLLEPDRVDMPDALALVLDALLRRWGVPSLDDLEG